MNPRLEQAYLMKAKAFAQTKDPEAAAATLKDFLASEPHNVPACYQLAKLYANSGNAMMAAHWIEAAIDAGFADWETLRGEDAFRQLIGTEPFQDLSRRFPKLTTK